MPRLFTALIATTALLAACASESSGASDGAGGGDLTGVTWVLDHASMMLLTADMPDDAEIDIAFDGAEVGGRAACNSYGGGYDADSSAGTLSFSELYSTAMACDPPQLMTLESAYLAALGNVTTYAVTGGGKWLVLTSGNKALTFVAQQPAEPLPLEGTAWTLTTIATPGTQAVSSTIAGTKVTALFDLGAVSGSGGCNTYHGTYETSGSSLTFGPVSSTMKMCEQGVSDQEQAYFAGLDATASYAVEGDQLTLSDAGGQLLLRFSGKAIR